jgi:chitinase
MFDALLRRPPGRDTEKQKRVALGALIATLMTTTLAVPAIAGQGGVTDDGEGVALPSSPSPSPSPVSGGAGGSGSGFPARYAAPYIETWGSPSELERARQAGLRYATLAFVLDGGDCRATFNGNTPVTDQGWRSAVEGLRSSGGDVIASFGGASGTELGQGCRSVSALQEQYRTVVDALGLSRLDFDIEGSALADSAANHRRNQALAALQQQYAAAGRTLDVQFTLPSGTHGLEQDGVALLRDAESTGLRVTLVNIMTMDYGSHVQDMGQAAIDAATDLHEQLGQIWTSKSPQELWAMEGNTPMIGVNDTPGEVFTTDDATRVESFAADKGIQQLSFWAVGRDKACSASGTLSDSCSGTAQSDYQFSRIFDAITTTAPGTEPGTTPVPGPVPTDSGTPVPTGSGTPDTPGTGSGAADPRVAPGGNFDLSIWQLQEPVGSGSPTTISSSRLQGPSGYKDSYFYTDPDGAMTFWAPEKGVTTPNAKYARSELREVNRDGSAAQWSPSGTHRMSATLRVASVTSHVCVGQIHLGAGGSSTKPLLELYYDSNGDIVLGTENSPSGGQTKHTVGHVSIGETWSYTIGVSGGNTIDLTVNGSTTHYPIPSSFEPYKLYFKAGSYNQSSSDSTTNGARVAFYGLTVSHS